MIPKCINPYPGPESFSRGDARPYFGRDQETSDLTSMAVTERLMVFYAPSGAGKTSLLNMRLIPRLEDKLYEVLPTARVSGVAIIPANVRNVYTYNLMLRIVPDDPQPERFAELSLSDFLWRLSTEDGKSYHYDPSDQALRRATPERDLWPRVLILDQFEEIVTTYPTYWRHREDFFRQLDEALSSDAMLRVIMSLRSDYVQDLERYAGLLQYGLRARYQMFLMGVDDAHLAIEGPAAACGRTFEPGVAQQLVRNMSQVREQDFDGKMRSVPGETVEPIQLQVVCYQLWQSMKQAPGNKIEMKDLQRLARTAMAARADSDQLTQRQKYELLSAFVDGALGAFYETALSNARASAAAQVDEAFLRNWFSTQLITESGTRGFMQRGHDGTGGVPDEVVQALVDHHLLRSDTRGTARLVELIHDRFVEPILRFNQRWSVEQLQRDPLLRRAHEWAASAPAPAQRDPGLLLTDDELAALDLGGRVLEPVMEEFVEASQRAKEQRDLTAAHQREEETQRELARERHVSRRLWVATGIAGLMFVIAVAAWFLVFRQADKLATTNVELTTANTAISENAAALAAVAADAEEARKEAEIERSIARSLMLANQSLDTSSPEDRLLLALAATQASSSTLLADAALLSALDDSYRLTADDSMAAYTPHERLGIAADRRARSLAFSHDGRLLALGDENGGVTLWDNANSQLVGRRTVAHSANSVYTLAFDPISPRLVSATADRDNPAAARHDLVLWDLSDPAAPIYQALAANRPSIRSAAWSPDGQQLAVANQDGTVELWSNLSGTEPVSRTLPGRHGDWAFSVAFNQEGDRLASAGKDGVIILWTDLASSTLLSQTLTDHTASVNVVAFSPDRTQLASGSDDGTLRLWDLTQDPPTSRVLDNHADQGIEVWDLAFSADGAGLAAGWGDKLARVYDLRQPGAPPWVLAGHEGEVSHVAFDPTAPQRLVSLGIGDYEPMAWDLSRTSEFASIQAVTTPVSSTLVAISSNGQWLAVGDQDRTVWLGDVMSDSPVISYTADMTITAVALSGDGSRVALAGCRSTLPSVQGMSETTDTQKSSDRDQAGTRLTGCLLKVSPAETGKAIASTYTITAPQRIMAVAFRPQRPDQWAIALESGAVQTSGAFAAGAVSLPRRVTEVVDLAFDSNGQQLAALSRGGMVAIWNWTTGELVEERSPDESQELRRFHAIEFVHGDEWLALASTAGTETPELALWERKTRTLMDRFRLDGAATALSVSTGGGTLTAALPGQVVRWPMSQTSWQALACDRAGRNLSYDAWRKAFPSAERDETQEALLCAYPLDVSFSEALVAKADQALDDCLPKQLDAGMALLREAATDARLKLDPKAHALEVLSGKTLEHLRQPLPAYDVNARECLDMAIRLVTFDAQQAFDAGRGLVRAEEQLADAQANAGPIVDLLEEILQNNAPWPNDFLQRQTLALLPTAYHRLCQEGDEKGCQRFAAVAKMIASGETVTGHHQAGNDQPVYFQGQRGQAVTIAMNADNNAFDTFLRLEGPAGMSIGDDDSGPDLNSLIANYLLPHDGIYRIIPSAYSGGGDYRLTLAAQFVPELAVNQATSSTAAGSGNLWRFQGERGQLVAIDLAMAEFSDPAYLTLERLDRSWAVTSIQDETIQRVAPMPLPADDLYVVRVETNGATIPYTLTLRQIEPPMLTLGEAQRSTLDATDLWALAGQPGQIISATLLVTDTLAQPKLELLDDRGEVLKTATSDFEPGVATITWVILPNGGPIFARPSGIDRRTPYRLSVGEVTPGELQPGDGVVSTTNGNTFWTLAGEPGQVVRISLSATRETSLDTLVRLFDPSGEQIDWDDDGGQGRNSLLTLVLPGSAPYLVQADRWGGFGEFTLAVTALPTETIPLDNTANPISPDRAWSLQGDAGQVLRVTIVDENGDGSYPALRLVTADGSLVGSGDGASSLVAVLPQSGAYILVPRFDLDSSWSGDTFQATLADPAQVSDLNAIASQTIGTLATGNAIDAALSLYRWGTTDGSVQFSADARNKLCWFGALRGAVEEVIDLCEGLPDPSETADLAAYRDTRGLARALAGDIAGAIADFEYFATNYYDLYKTAQRRAWVERLRAGEPVSEVLDAATLRELLSQ